MEDCLANLSIQCGQRVVEKVDLSLLIDQPEESMAYVLIISTSQNNCFLFYLARATLCFCPPDKLIPFSPISVLSPAAINCESMSDVIYWFGEVFTK